MQIFNNIHQILIKQLLLFSHSVVSDPLWPHGLQHTRLPCPSPSLRVCSNSCPLSQFCHPIISSSVIPFSSCLLSFPATGSFPMNSFFASGGQGIRSDRVPEELWTEVHNIVQEAVIKTIPPKRNAKKQNGCLTNRYEKKGSEKQRRKGKIYPFECRVPKNSKER